MDISAFNQLVRSRHSVFPDQFEPGKKADDAIIQEILENANSAPNHGREQPWHFTVFTGAGLQKLADFQSALYKEKAGTGFKEATFVKLSQNPLRASHVIAITLKRSTKPAIPEVEDIAAVACAVQNIALSVHAYGLGGYWGSGGVTYYPEAKPFFGLGPDDRLLGFFYIGVIAVPSSGNKRIPKSEKSTWITE